MRIVGHLGLAREGFIAILVVERQIAARPFALRAFLDFGVGKRKVGALFQDGVDPPRHIRHESNFVNCFGHSAALTYAPEVGPSVIYRHASNLQVPAL